MNFFNCQIIKFGLLSVVGLSLDMLLFYILTKNNFAIIISNCLSAFTAVSFLYIMSIRFIFKEQRYDYKKYILFIAYYTISILLFSFAINFINKYFVYYPLYAKLLTVPFSFLVNYFCSSKIV